MPDKKNSHNSDTDCAIKDDFCLRFLKLYVCNANNKTKFQKQA